MVNKSLIFKIESPVFATNTDEFDHEDWEREWNTEANWIDIWRFGDSSPALREAVLVIDALEGVGRG